MTAPPPARASARPRCTTSGRLSVGIAAALADAGSRARAATPPAAPASSSRRLVLQLPTTRHCTLARHVTPRQRAVASGRMHIDPTSEQAQSFGATAERPEPVFMLNLLRFKEGDGTESYARYTAAASEHLARVGGAILWAGACDEALIGPAAREWDCVAVVRYPSRAAFLEMVR